MSSSVARNATAVTGPTPGTVASRRATGSAARPPGHPRVGRGDRRVEGREQLDQRGHRRCLGRRHRHPLQAPRKRGRAPEVLDILQDHYRRHGKALRRSLILGLRERLGPLLITQLTRKHLDDLADEWLARGITYSSRDPQRNPQHPVDGATVNRAFALLRQARALATEGLNLVLPA